MLNIEFQVFGEKDRVYIGAERRPYDGKGGHNDG